MNELKSGPIFLRYCIPIIKVIRDNGGSGTPSRLTDLVIKECSITEEEEKIPNKNGASKIRNQIAWARFYLVKAGLIDGRKKGQWSLTDLGKEMDLEKVDIKLVFRDVAKRFKIKKTVDDEDVDDEIEEENHKTKIIGLVKKLSPVGFEKFVKRVLTESGFESVEVTGKSGDGGIDGHGILKINDLTSMKVVFQCKRYKDSVGSGAIRDFRGAMAGRTDKGIVITTGYFTADAKTEATRDGVAPIELVDGDGLVVLMEKYELGLIEKKVYDIDEKFFDSFI
jgi:restriction system protein